MEEETVFNLPCDHTFHTRCLMTWFIVNASCPVCRREYSVRQTSDQTNEGSNLLFNFLNYTRNRTSLIERAVATTHIRVQFVERRLLSIQTMAFGMGFLGALAGILFANTLWV